MKRIILVAAPLLLLSNFGCTPLKRAETSIARGIAGSATINVDGHEVYCSEGRVCSEIDVLNISVEDRDGGRVRVTLKNRTGNTALLQLRLQIRHHSGEVLLETRPENVPIPSTQEKIYEMPGVYRKGAVVRVLMNVAH